MNNITAFTRKEKGSKARKCGYIPGVLYGTEIKESCSVKFNKLDIMKIIKNSGDSAKLIVELDGDKKYGIIKSIQRNPIKADDIYNIDVQIVSKSEEIKQAVPVLLEGKEFIEAKGLSIQTQLTEIDVIAKAIDIPGNFTINVKNKNNGDVIIVKDIEENGDFKIINEPDAVIAAVFYGTKQEE